MRLFTNQKGGRWWCQSWFDLRSPPFGPKVPLEVNAMFYLKGKLMEVEDGGGPTEKKHSVILDWIDSISPRLGYFLLNMSMIGVGMNFMTVSTMLSSSSSSPQPVGTAFFGRVRLPSEACSIAAAASASFSSFFLMPYYTGKWRDEDVGQDISIASVMLKEEPEGKLVSSSISFLTLVCCSVICGSVLTKSIPLDCMWNGCSAQRVQ